MKLIFKEQGRPQPDPYIFYDDGKYYLYCTGYRGPDVYVANSKEGPYEYLGICCDMPNHREFWAPCIFKKNDMYYLYFSCFDKSKGEGCGQEHIYAASSHNPKGPFENPKCLYDKYFNIDPHVVETTEGIFIFFAADNEKTDKIGTRVFVDRLLDPETPANSPKEVILPSFNEEIFQKNRYGDGRDWYTIEGAFWFYHEGCHYLMYSGGCYENDSYHIGYCTAVTDNMDLTAVNYQKHVSPHNDFEPLLFKNDVEEGTGHHSILEENGNYYIIYHGRDAGKDAPKDQYRTARICKMQISDNHLIVTDRTKI